MPCPSPQVTGLGRLLEPDRRRRPAAGLPESISDMDMTCGYCGQCVSLEETLRSLARLTGVHSLGVHRQTGELVVLAEVTSVAARPASPATLRTTARRSPTASGPSTPPTSAP